MFSTPTNLATLTATSPAGRRAKMTLHFQCLKSLISSEAIVNLHSEHDCDVEEYLDQVQNVRDIRVLKQKIINRDKRETIHAIKGSPCESTHKFRKCMRKKNARQKSPAYDFK